MEQKLPRLVIAGTNSGCGKTTVTCAVLQALVNRGLSVAAAKCGPDYIDPMFHSRIIGAKSANLDPFFFDEPTLRYLLAQNAAGCAVTIIEGVMGYYDGLGLTTTRASTWETAQKTASPTILVVNARGAALSVLAAVQGFLQFQPHSGIRGVILNGCTAMSYAPLAEELEARFGIKACGYLPRLPACTLESRHLGLVTAAEVADLREKLQRLAAQAETSIDLDLLLRLANERRPLLSAHRRCRKRASLSASAWRATGRSAFTMKTASRCYRRSARSSCPSARWRTRCCRRGCTGCTSAAAIRSFPPRS